MGGWASASRASKAAFEGIVVTAQQYAEHERSRANLPHRADARRKHQEEHKEEIAEYKKAWIETNTARMAAFKREYYERERVIARSEKWGRNNAEKVEQFKANNIRKRRAAKHVSLGDFTAREFEEFCERYGKQVRVLRFRGLLAGGRPRRSAGQGRVGRHRQHTAYVRDL